MATVEDVAVLVRLRGVSGEALAEVITDGWLACAPPALAERYLRRQAADARVRSR